MRSTSLDSIDPIRLAWLLRADLRRGLEGSGPIPHWFKTWWMIEGRREYPAWDKFMSHEVKDLFAPVPDWPSYGPFGMSTALNYILKKRTDLHDQFDCSCQTGLWSAIAWFYVHGVREYNLINHVSTAVRRALDTTPPFLSHVHDQTPGITWLMYFAWLNSPDLRSTFDLRNDLDRHEYLQWFLLKGVSDLGIHDLLAERWRTWLHEPVKLPSMVTALPRIGFLLWQRRNDLRQRFNLRTAAGVTHFSSWLENAWHESPELRWLKIPVRNQPPHVKKRLFGVNLIGFAYGELGIGEDVRMAAAACESANIPYSIVNIHPGAHLRQQDLSLARQVEDTSRMANEMPYAVNVFCLTGFDTARVVLERGPHSFSGHYNVGWWPWELPVWPAAWNIAFRLINEVWAATDFTFKMYSSATALMHTPPLVRKMPMAASIARKEKTPRAHFGLPKNKFLFLYIFDFNSYLSRKYPSAAITAFERAFRGDPSVGLVLKTMNPDTESLEWQNFRQRCAADTRITLLDHTMDRGKVLGLVDACDAYVSLHRSEGLGRTLAEAMLLGKPVVATDFSGNRDFLNRKNGFPVKWTKRKVAPGEYPFISQSDEAYWAEPDIDHAAMLMRLALKADPGFKDEIKKSVDCLFDPLQCGKKLMKRLTEIEHLAI